MPTQCRSLTREDQIFFRECWDLLLVHVLGGCDPLKRYVTVDTNRLNYFVLPVSQKASKKDYSKVTINLPNNLIDFVDELKIEWGLKSRESVFTRLLETISEND